MRVTDPTTAAIAEQIAERDQLRAEVEAFKRSGAFDGCRWDIVTPEQIKARLSALQGEIDELCAERVERFAESAQLRAEVARLVDENAKLRNLLEAQKDD